MEPGTSTIETLPAREAALVAAEPAPAAPVAAALLERLLSWADPEGLLAAAVVLLPAGFFWLLGDTVKASFFAGAGVYVAVLKWLGWVVLPRRASVPAFLYFPAQLFVGAVVLCGWFYLRNLLGWLWPAGYSLRELAALPVLLLALHLTHAAVRLTVLSRSGAELGGDQLRALLQRLALYLPFVLTLTMALWVISGTLQAQCSDALYYGTMGRSYLQHGLFQAVGDNQHIIYPSGFGALVAVTAACSPLSVAQAVALEHVLLIVACVFLVTTTLAGLAQRPLAGLHWLGLVFLTLYPLHGLYPDVSYQGAPRQAAPALLAALGLLPLLSCTTRRWHFHLMAGLLGMLAALTMVLNPACTSYALLALLLGLLVLGYRSKTALGASFYRACGVQLATLLAIFVLVIGSDGYYRMLAGDPTSVPPRDQQTGQAPRFAAVSAIEAARDFRPLSLAPLDSITQPPPEWLFLLGWTDWPLSRALLGVAHVLTLLLLLLVLKGRGERPAGVSALTALATTCLGLRLGLKLVMTCLAGGLSREAFETHVLAVYTNFLLLRCEILLVFVSMAAAATGLYLLAEPLWRQRTRWSWAAAIVLAELAGLALFGVVRYGKENLVLPAVNLVGAVTTDDLKLVAWVDANLPPERGRIAPACWTVQAGINEKQIHACDGAQALQLYGQHDNYAFVAWDGYRMVEFHDQYNANVRDGLNAAWCLGHDIRYFYITPYSLGSNPGLVRAIAQGALRPVHSAGKSCVFEVLPPPPQPTPPSP